MLMLPSVLQLAGNTIHSCCQSNCWYWSSKDSPSLNNHSGCTLGLQSSSRRVRSTGNLTVYLVSNSRKKQKVWRKQGQDEIHCPNTLPALAILRSEFPVFFIYISTWRPLLPLCIFPKYCSVSYKRFLTCNVNTLLMFSFSLCSVAYYWSQCFNF